MSLGFEYQHQASKRVRTPQIAKVYAIELPPWLLFLSSMPLHSPVVVGEEAAPPPPPPCCWPEEKRWATSAPAMIIPGGRLACEDSSSICELT